MNEQVVEVKNEQVVEVKIEKVVETAAVLPDPLLTHILGYRRCYGSSGDITFRTWLAAELKKLKCTSRVAHLGNIIAQVGKKSTTLFSCHTDTVHNMNESNTKQELFYDPDFGHIFIADKKSSTCLGADDGVGVWIMLCMIAAGVQGTYVFHVGEEKGGVGARGMLDKERPFLEQFDRSIAFDRPGTHEVICTQGGTACASETFGNQLAGMLNQAGLDYEISHKGVFTDNKIYATVIPENVNLGVGYYNQHSTSEYLDYNHAQSLMKACLKLDWESLKPVRSELFTPAPARAQTAWDHTFPFPTSKPTPKPTPKPALKPALKQLEGPSLEMWQEAMLLSCEEIHETVAEDTWVAAQMIISLVVELEAEKAKTRAYLRLTS